MKRGFSLVEILVALGIVALLACLVVPSCKILQARANSARCMGNLRALGSALQLYLGENQMIMPTLDMARSSTSEDRPVIDNTLNRYVDDQRVFICPAGRQIALESGTSYLWNFTLNGQTISNIASVKWNELLHWNNLGEIPVISDKEGWHQYTQNKVNHLFADGHVSTELQLIK